MVTRGRCCDCERLIPASEWCGPVCDAPMPSWATIKSEDDRIIKLDAISVWRNCEAFQKRTVANA